MIEKIHIIVALFAALAVTILSLYQDITFYELSKRLVVVIPVFFVIGMFFRLYLKRLLMPPVEPTEVTPESGESDAQEEQEEGSEDGVSDDESGE